MEHDYLNVVAARQELAAAQRARLAAEQPRALPARYSLIIGGLMVMWLGAVDVVRAWQAPWVFAVAGGLYSFGLGLALGVWRRQGGVVPRLRGPLLGRSVLGAFACAAVGASVLAVGLAVDFLLAGTVAGVAMAASFVAYGRLINRRVATLAGEQ